MHPQLSHNPHTRVVATCCAARYDELRDYMSHLRIVGRPPLPHLHVRLHANQESRASVSIGRTLNLVVNTEIWVLIIYRAG